QGPGGVADPEDAGAGVLRGPARPDEAAVAGRAADSVDGAFGAGEPGEHAAPGPGPGAAGGRRAGGRLAVRGRGAGRTARDPDPAADGDGRRIQDLPAAVRTDG